MKSCYMDMGTRSIVDLIRIKDRTWLIARINVPVEHRGHGYGSRILDMVCTEADHHGVSLVLDIMPSGELNYYQLQKWYGRHGFERMPEHPDIFAMRRAPKQ